MIADGLAALAGGRSLTRAESRACVEAMLVEGASPVLASAWLVALRMKGETDEEIAGVVDALRARAEKLEIRDRDAVDTCGTGGDGASTFNISTAAAFVVAGAGVTVAKHGNRAVSSKSGSADVLAALGVNLDAPIEKVRRSIDDDGIGFLFAQRHHAAMRFVGPVRKELKIRTIFNLAGPLSNPAGVRRQVVGVYERSRVEPMAKALLALGAVRAWVVHGEGSVDELSIAGPTFVAEVKDGAVRTFVVTPKMAGIAVNSIGTLGGGEPGECAAIIGDVLEGSKGPRRDAVVLNAAAALVVAEKASDLREGVAIASHAIDSGAARGKLEALVRGTA